jgi:two-component sensor histidine kinase
VVHELATNAVKYGALSVSTGRIDIGGERAGDALALTWRERGGPAVAGPPERKGFGDLMTARTVSGQLGGAIAYHWTWRA